MAARDALILQFRADRAPLDHGTLLDFEEVLIQAYSQNGTGIVDGHDIAPTGVNIFIYPRGSWRSCIEVAMAYLKLKKLLQAVVVVKRLKGGTYDVIWPADYAGEYERV